MKSALMDKDARVCGARRCGYARGDSPKDPELGPVLLRQIDNPALACRWRSLSASMGTTRRAGGLLGMLLRRYGTDRIWSRPRSARSPRKSCPRSRSQVLG